MAMIRCKNCGKHYSYEGGCCPKCGAFNRRPRRTTISADGEVHHMDGRNLYDGVVPEHGGRKVCFEEEQCFEAQTEYPRRWQKRRNRRNPAEAFQVPKPVQDLEDEFRNLGEQLTKKTKTTSSNKVIGITAVISVVVMMIPAILGFVLEAYDGSDYEDPRDPSPIELYVGPGECFESEEDKMIVVDCSLTKLEDGAGEFRLAVVSGWDHKGSMTLYCWDTQGEYTAYGAYAAEYKEADGMFHYVYRFADVEGVSKCMLQVEDWFNEEIVWVVLPMTIIANT